MASVHDVAAYILRSCGPLDAMKLQKLVYYCQAWSLVWDSRPLFRAKIEAWSLGPVVPRLYRHHRGQFLLRRWESGDARRLSHAERETIDAVLAHYGGKSSQWLSDLTHREPPWRDARKGLSSTDRSTREITLDSMAEYYGSLQ